MYQVDKANEDKDGCCFLRICIWKSLWSLSSLASVTKEGISCDGKKKVWPAGKWHVSSPVCLWLCRCQVQLSLRILTSQGSALDVLCMRIRVYLPFASGVPDSLVLLCLFLILTNHSLKISCIFHSGFEDPWRN